MAKKSIADINLSGKRVLVRVDYNVPLDDNGNITDDTRITSTLPTIKYLLEKNCKIILIAHLGRPKGKPNPKYSLRPVSNRLSELLNKEVKFAEDCRGEVARKAVSNISNSQILLLENLRFYAEEEGNDINFAQELAGLAEIFVQDAFGTVHRAHASTDGVPKYLPSVSGFLVQKEIEYLSKALEKPERPFLSILGGAKVSDKIEVINNLLTKVDSLIIGGAMAYTFLKAQGIGTGDSLVEPEKIDVAKEILANAEKSKVPMLLPIDHLIAKELNENSETQETKGVEIPTGWKGVDIGASTIQRFANIILKSKTIVWNGPLGIFEINKFSKGTISVAKHLAEATLQGATTIIGGGDTGAAVAKAGVEEKMSHISTGGGAALEFLEGKQLPGIVALNDK